MRGTAQVTIFGGAGYLGGHAGHALHADGFRTTLASRAAEAGSGPAWVHSRVQVDWTDAASVRNALSGSSIVIHAAGPDAQACAHDPGGSERESEFVARSIAEATVAARATRLIVFSTVHAGVEKPSAYGRTALARERAARASCTGSRTRLVIVRIANCFGPPVARAPGCWKLAVNSMCLAAVRRREIHLASDGSASRDFVPASGLAACILAIAKMPTEQLPDAIIEACTGRRRTVLEMAQLIQGRCRKILGFKPEITVGNAVETAPLPRPDPSALAEIGVVLADHLIPEIDALLRCCSTADHALLPQESMQ